MATDGKGAEAPPAEADALDLPDELTVEQALNLAMHLHRSERLDSAQALYERVIEAAPGRADALHLLGILHHQCGRSDRAVALIGEALRLAPGQAGMHNNLGNVLMEEDRPREAAAAYRASIALEPRDADAHNNLGVVLKRLGERRDAEAAYRLAIEVDPAHCDALNNLGRLLAGDGRLDEAIMCHARALEFGPRDSDTRRALLAAYAAAGQIERATATAADWLRDDPDNATARHMMAAISGHDVPARASDAYVEAAFDRFAASFDTRLAGLGYRAPELVAAAVRAACGPPRGTLAVLDAGCGTGLCGPLLAPFAAALTGIDLSARMLEKARLRGGYDALYKVELTRFMLDQPEAFDLIVSADTLCYFGALDAVLAAAAGALRPGGVLAFSVEAGGAGLDVRLNPHGRYNHGRRHVAEALARAGLRMIALGEEVLRQEKRRPVAGFVVTALRTEGAPGG